MFQFASDKKSVNSLIVKLEAAGLLLVNQSEEYLTQTWSFKTRWPSDSTYRIVWLQHWVNDGQSKEDIGVELYVCGKQLDTFEFDELVKNQEAQPLRQLIIKTIIEVLGHATGNFT